MKRAHGRVILLLALATLGNTHVLAECKQWVAELVSIQGTIEWRNDSSQPWQKASSNERFCLGATVRTQENSRAALRLSNRTILRLKPRSTLRLNEIHEKKSSWLELLEGVIHIFSRTPKPMEINTPFVNAAIEGTEFVVEVHPDKSESLILVYEGRVRAQNNQGQLTLAPGESARAKKGEAPAPYIKVKPRDGVQWTLYFPPVVYFDPNMPLEGKPWRQYLRNAIRAYAAGDITQAFQALNKVDQEKAGIPYYLFRASVYLHIGAVKNANADIMVVNRRDSENAQAMALKAIIAVVEDEKENALNLASKAVAKSGRSSAALIALSYAQQAQFKLTQALDSARKATKLQPNDAIAWARLAELSLAHNKLPQSLKAARKAADLAPTIARIQTIFGFALLKQFKPEKAMDTFAHAIALDPAAPLPRLGLGIAKIKRGRLAAGRQDIEIAVSLDPGNSTVRSYLGKAYYAENRFDKSSSQFLMAIERDPKDPTPWLYRAIQNDVSQRTIAALKDINRSIQLNDNRAVYRSRLLLDQDLAVRTTNLAKIYKNLGFEQRAIVEGVNSLQVDPFNASAHAFLADAYAGRPRYDIARESELLQAQMHQPLSNKPIRNYYASNHFRNIGKGSFNLAGEMHGAVFEREDTFYEMTAIGGNNGTTSDDLSVSGRHDRFAYRIGHFLYDTDGFRANADLKQNVYTGFLQTQISDNIMLQIEAKNEEVKRGDIEIKYDSDSGNPTLRRNLFEQARGIGVSYNANISNRFLFRHESTGLNNELSGFLLGSPDEPFYLKELRKAKRDSNIDEIQYTRNTRYYQVIFGGSKVKQDRKETIRSDDFFLGDLTTTFSENDEDISFETFYLYTPIRISSNINILFGVSHSDFNRKNYEKDKLSHKLGLSWDLLESLKLRLSSFNSLKRPNSFNRSLEPSHIVGFNQSFDDNDGSDTDRHGIGLDYRLGLSSYSGVEWTRGSKNDSIIRDNERNDVDTDEEYYRFYYYGTIGPFISTSLETFYSTFDNSEFISPDNVNSPVKLDTIETPLTITLRTHHGFSTTLVARYIDQEIVFNSSDGSRKENTHFWLGDAYISYRLKNSILFSLGVRNISDTHFKYQPALSTDTRITQEPELQPSRRVFTSLQLWF